MSIELEKSKKIKGDEPKRGTEKKQKKGEAKKRTATAESPYG